MAVMSPLAATLSMGQPIIPASKANIAPTDVLGAYQMSTNQANQQYLAKLQQQNSLWGGLAGLGGSGLTAAILKGNLFGAPAAAATTAAAPAATAAATAPFESGVAGLGNFAGVPLAGLDVPAADAAGTAAADAAASGAADAGGTVAADLAASAAPAAVDATADAGMTLADLLPFLFSA